MPHSGLILSNKPDICVGGQKSDCFLTRAEALVVLAILASLRSSSLAEMSEATSWTNSLLSFLCAIRNIIIKERQKKRPFGFANWVYNFFIFLSTGCKDEPFKHLYSRLSVSSRLVAWVLQWKAHCVEYLQKDVRMIFSLRSFLCLIYCCDFLGFPKTFRDLRSS